MAERGRPRAFDEEEVLDVAMRLFWDHGFDGTSMSDLTDAMGIEQRTRRFRGAGHSETTGVTLLRPVATHCLTSSGPKPGLGCAYG